MLNRLEQIGYITRSSDRDDNRKVIVSLTEKSKLLKERYEIVSQEMTSLFYDGLAESQIDEFEKILTHIMGNLVKYEEE